MRTLSHFAVLCLFALAAYAGADDDKKPPSYALGLVVMYDTDAFQDGEGWEEHVNKPDEDGFTPLH